MRSKGRRWWRAIVTRRVRRELLTICFQRCTYDLLVEDKIVPFVPKYHLPLGYNYEKRMSHSRRGRKIICIEPPESRGSTVAMSAIDRRATSISCAVFVETYTFNPLVVACSTANDTCFQVFGRLCEGSRLRT